MVLVSKNLTLKTPGGRNMTSDGIAGRRVAPSVGTPGGTEPAVQDSHLK